jgi:GH25 family lysozyme M1 (1,4-beta-N-acetylmuramidase)
MTANEVLAPVEKLAGNRETNGGNNTAVNTHYGAPGQAYCGYTVRYGFEMSGNSAAIASCPSVIWVPTFRAWAAENWTRIDNAQAQKGDVFFYKTQHTGFVYAPYDGRTVITLEGNADVYATRASAELSSVGSGDFEGIGYKKRYLSDDFRIYRPPYSAESSTTVNMVGVDVSYWNGYNVDWEKAKAAGIDFAIVRAGYGLGNLDSTAGGNAKRAKAAGVHVGYYWFSYAATAEEARKEADFCCDAIERIGVAPDMPVCFDYEYDSVEKAPPQESIVNLARAFLSRVKERGYYPANYTNYDFLSRGFDQLVGEYDLWLAQWGVSKPGRDCQIWQYTSTGRPDGVSGVADMNICYKDYPSIIGGDTPKPTPTPTPTPSEDKCMVQTNIIKNGSKGSTVKSWQTLLNFWGFNCGNADGIFGGKTEEATKKFQKEYGLEVDGVVGSATWGMMLA